MVKLDSAFITVSARRKGGRDTKTRVARRTDIGVGATGKTMRGCTYRRTLVVSTILLRGIALLWRVAAIAT